VALTGRYAWGGEQTRAGANIAVLAPGFVGRGRGLGADGRKAGTLEADAVADALHSHEFDTVLGSIGFDDKGDVHGYEPFTWCV
jgi:hypothetical protein